MPEHTITLDQAQSWATKWNTDKITFLQSNDLKAFKILGSVLDDVTAPSDVVDIRAYFGIDANNNPHLCIVGVDANGNDLIDPASGHHIYNFAAPCPNNCSNSSIKINR